MCICNPKCLLHYVFIFLFALDPSRSVHIFLVKSNLYKTNFQHLNNSMILKQNMNRTLNRKNFDYALLDVLASTASILNLCAISLGTKKKS